jgi:sugar phosphate isomerase/epimerase
MNNPLAFSTLACPEWPAEVVVEKAAAFGYDAFEWRGGDHGHVPPQMPAQRLADLRRQQDAAGLQALAVTAYTSFVSDTDAKRQAALDHLREHCDIAAVLGAGYVRAFLNENEPVAEPARYYDRLADSLRRAADYAQSVGVGIAIEPHDEFIHSATIAPLLGLLPSPAVGVIWDLGNTYAAGEGLDDGLQHLGSRLSYVQVKDGRGRGAAWQLARLGEGEVPIGEAMRRLVAAGYDGAFSLEWERAWHPELDPAETALPAALQTMRAWLAEARLAARPVAEPRQQTL